LDDTQTAANGMYLMPPNLAGPADAVEDAEAIQTVRSFAIEGVVEVRDEALREIDVRLLPWDTTIETVLGPEEFARGAFTGTADNGMYLMPPNHAGVQLAIGQDGSPVPTRTPVGRSVRVHEEDDGPHATFRVARTAGGDETLALARDGILTGVSVEFSEVPGGTVIVQRSGRRARQHKQVRALAAVLTHRPAYGELAAVLAVRSHHEEAPVTEAQTPAPEAPAIVQTSEAPITMEHFRTAMGAMAAEFGKPLHELVERMGKIEEQSRSQFTLPGAAGEKKAASLGKWTQWALRSLTGERISEIETRELADLITTDNLGVVPPNYSSEMIGIIDPSRPFLESTTKIDEGDSGMSLILPKITTRPTTGVQAAEKDEVTSTATSITTATYTPVTVAGAGDISIQLLKRSSPSFLTLYLQLLAEAYAIDADDLAVDALLAQAAVVEGGEFDPADPSLGSAWANAAAVSRLLTPNRIWLSTTAMAAFIDAKADGTNQPLWSNISANFTAAGGAGGTVSGLRPVHVPALDDEAVDIIVGPSRGFLWAEDGTYTLQVDVPAKAGRDVALVGMLWFAPIYPAAFTTYTLPAS
jgi:phage head maturation protease